MLYESDFDADPLAHDVVGVWRTASGVSEGFKTLFEKMQAYRNAKAVADNRHKTKMLTAQYVELERRAKKKFLDSYQNGRSFLHRAHGQIPGGCSVGKLNRGSRIFSGTKAVQTLTRTMRLGFFRGKPDSAICVWRIL